MTSCLISSTIVELRVEGAIEARDERIGVPFELIPLLPYGPIGGFSLTISAGAAGTGAFFAPPFLCLK